MSEEDNKDYCNCCNCETSKPDGTNVWARMKRAGMYTPEYFAFYEKMRKEAKQALDNNKEE